MRRVILSTALLGGLSLAGCHAPAKQFMAQVNPHKLVTAVQSEPEPLHQPAPTERAPRDTTPPVQEVAFYDLTESYGLRISIDLVTGRRVCQDGVNTLEVMPGTHHVVLNQQQHPLGGMIRWRDGVLYMPGEARAVLAEHMRLVPVPEVASDPKLFNGTDPGADLFLPASARRTEQPNYTARRAERSSASMPGDWKVKGERRWRYIVIHHSATGAGGAESFHREHAKKWQNGLGYHFVIGNGTHTGDGEIEVGTRWKRQGQGIDGAHAGNKRYNKWGIGICLVGSFNNGGRPTAKQLDALRLLCQTLMTRYGIPKSQIFPHKDVRRGHTDCPGKSFPFQQFVRSIR